jgi:hypothetical protein
MQRNKWLLNAFLQHNVKRIAKPFLSDKNKTGGNIPYSWASPEKSKGRRNRCFGLSYPNLITRRTECPFIVWHKIAIYFSHLTFIYPGYLLKK